MPNGVRFIECEVDNTPEPEFHSFVITREDGTQKYGGCLTYFVPVTDTRITATFQVGVLRVLLFRI